MGTVNRNATQGELMQITIKGRHWKVTPDYRAYAERRIEKLQRYFSHLISAQLTVTEEGYRHQAELRIFGNGLDVTGRAQDPDARVALDMVLEKQERALKRRGQMGWVGRTLPPLAEAEGMQIRLLTWSAGLMAAALATGAANEVIETGEVLAFTHKILLAFLAFALILVLLFLHQRTGLRGRHAARWLLVGYLLLLLAYPGVKFVRDVLIG